MNTVTIILISVSLLLIAFICLTIKPRKKSMLNKLGECLLPLKRKFSWLFLAVIIFGIILVCLQFFRQFQLFIAIVLNAVAVLGVETTIKDLILQQIAGIYENGIVIDSRLINKTDIVSLPTLEYENSEEYKQEKLSDQYSSESYETAKKTLKIITNSSGEIFVSFDNADERNKAVEIIRKWL